MLYALTSAYSRKDYNNQQQSLPMETNIGKLFSIFAWGLDVVHENAELVKQWDDLEQAKGAVLDRYGANWGVQRFSENDALYRLAIRVKILSQLSGGDTDTVINAAADLLGVENYDIDFEDVFPAKIFLYVDWLLLTQERQDLIEPIAWAIKRIVAAGVGFRLYIRTYREYRYNLPISHGGAIGRYYRHQPVGEDREVALDVPVAYGGAVETEFVFEPTGEGREAVLDVPVAHGGSVATGFHFEPTGKDRIGVTDIYVGRTMVQHPTLSAAPVGEDRSSGTAVPMSLGDCVLSTIAGAMPDSMTSGATQQESKGGAYMRSHIKPKRID